MRYILRILTLLVLSVCLGATSSALAQIAIQDGPSAVEYNTSAADTAVTLNAATFTVNPGASVLVVCLGLRTQGATPAPGSDPGAPATITWNGNTLTKAVSKGSTASTWDDNSIYYLMNPPAGSGSMVATLNTNFSQCWWLAYTLTNVNTSATVLTASANITPASPGPDYVTNSLTVPAGAWTALSGSASIGTHSSWTCTVLPSVGGAVNAVLPSVDDADGNADEFMGSVSNCFAGSSKFILLTGMASNPKMAMVSAVFTPVAAALAAPSLTANQPGGQPAQAQLSWSGSAGPVSYYYLMRSTNSTGPFTDYTNLLSGATTSFTDLTVLSGQTYYYAVVAVNAVSTNTSTTVSFTPNGPPFPPVLGVGAWGSNRLVLHWTSFGATSYIVGSSTTSGGETTLATVSGNSYTNSGLTAGTTYYYTVKAVGPGGTSSPSGEASAVALGTAWYLFDNFSLDTVGSPLNGQIGSAGLGQGWTNLGGGTPITVSNGAPFGTANYSEYAPGSPTSIGDYEAGLGIPGNSSVATVFLEFSLPGIQPPSAAGVNQTGANVVAMNFDIDNSSPPTALTGQSTKGPSAQFNYDNSSGFGYFRVYTASGGPYYVTLGPSSTPYAPNPGDLYYFWFVLNAAKGTYQIYLANGSQTGTNVDAGGLGAAPTLMWGAAADTGVGTLTTYAFRNAGATPPGPVGQPVNYIGTGPGSTLGTVAQNQFAAIYVDQGALDLVNPVTGQPPTGAFVLEQPQSVQLYAGATATFSVIASAGVTAYQWQTNAPGNTPVNLGGATNSTLVISNVSAANALNYSCLVFNPSSASIGDSQPATLTIVTPVGAYETAANAAGLVHYYAFNDTNNPGTSTETTPSLAYDFAGSDNGVYGASALNGFDSIYGPDSTNGFPGFAANNYAAQFAGNAEPNGVTIDSPWNLDTNEVTITAWINPNSTTEPLLTSIVMNRGSGTDVEGLIYGTNAAVTYNLGYEWNDDANTYSWESGLLPPANQWSFVTLVVTPTDATISLMNTNGLLSSTHTYPHPVAPFAGATMIGDDPGTPSGALAFNGMIDEVGIYNQALSQAQLQTLFFDASGLDAADFPPTNSVTLDTPSPIYPAMSAQFQAVVGGAVPLFSFWQINGTNVSDGPSGIGTIIGSATGSLIISNLTPGTSGQTYLVTLVTSNLSGQVFTSSPPASLSVFATSPATLITTTEIEAQGLDWNTGASWSDGNPASLSAYSEPGSIYEIVPGSMERSPLIGNAVFPGNVLVLAGSGALVDGNNTGVFNTTDGTGELRMKATTTATTNLYGTTYIIGGTITFPDLQLTGGQLDNGGTSAGTGSWVALNGQIDVLSNSTFYADSAASTYVRPIQINAYLTGSGTISYTFLGSASAYPYNQLIISCPTNTFSGQWSVGNGGLLGNAPNSLGTNSITVGPNGIFETTYNLNDTNASLTLNGQMYLYTVDTFNKVTINGTALNAGTYTFAQLNSAYPANFPTTWPVQLGSSTGTNTGSGSITVLTSAAPLSPADIVNATISGGNVTLSGNHGTPNATYHVLTSTNVTLPFASWTVLTSGSFDGSGNFNVTFPVTGGNSQQFYLLRSP